MRHLLATICLTAAVSASATVFYIDSSQGSDSADGQSPQTAWRTLEKVNTAPLQPGDSVLFRRGTLYRGCLSTVSGTEGRPVTYGAYGEGPKPIIQPSLDFNSPQPWTEVSPGIWRTPDTIRSKPGRHLADLSSQRWSLYCERGTDLDCSHVSDAQKRRTYTITCRTPGKRDTNVQFIGPKVPDDFTHCYFSFRMRSSIPFELPKLRIMLTRSPFSTYLLQTGRPTRVTADWQDFTVLLHRSAKGPDGKLNWFIGTAIPAGATIEFQPGNLTEALVESHSVILNDVGNIYFDHGRLTGWKRWKLEDLKQPRDFYHDLGTGAVYLRHDGNPGAGAYSSLELAPRHTIISHGGKHDVIIDGLHVRYSGGHGFSGGKTQRITIRNCDISYIGGSLLFTQNGRPVRYGNGVEFWSDSTDCLVENNRFWQIYDVAITNQGNQPNTPQRNLIYRNNLIFNCEQSYEYWRAPANAVTENIQFVGNTCLNAGKCWSHEQRPDKTACHLLGYGVSAKTSNVVIRNNVMLNGISAILRHHDNWLHAIDLDYNLWCQNDPNALLFHVIRDNLLFRPTQWDAYRATTGKDAHSLYAQPKFVRPDFDNPLNGDFRLAPDSPGYTGADDGGPIGIRWKQD